MLYISKIKKISEEIIPFILLENEELNLSYEREF